MHCIEYSSTQSKIYRRGNVDYAWKSLIIADYAWNSQWSEKIESWLSSIIQGFFYIGTQQWCCCMVLLHGAAAWCCCMVLLHGAAALCCCVVLLHVAAAWCCCCMVLQHHAHELYNCRDSSPNVWSVFTMTSHSMTSLTPQSFWATEVLNSRLII